jgi:two-component system, OmpR family, response regulator
VKKRILVVEDEDRIREVVEYALEREGWDVTLVGDGRLGLREAETGAFALCVLDVMLPELDGLSVCRSLRSGSSRGGRTPVLFLSARADEVDRIVGLELGGDDYLVKPFSPRELVARVRALLRRSEDSPREASQVPVVRDDAMRHGGIIVSCSAREVTCDGQPISLTATEFDLLACLLERPGQVFSRAQLRARSTIDEDAADLERAVDTHVKRIRAKFRPLGVDPITTVHGVGYKAS